MASDANDQRDDGNPGDDDDDEALIKFLAARDVPCPLCQYNLRGLRSPRCPECGRELRLTVGLSEPPLKAWIVVAACAWLSAGLGLLFVLLIIKSGLPPRRMGLAITYFIATIPAAVFVTVRRRAFLRLSNDKQSVIAASVVVITVAAFVLMFATVR